MSRAGVYISLPFCRQKCTYCNFASDVHPSLLPRYLDCLVDEIANRSAIWKKAGIPGWEDSPADSIYLGGGTPGMLAPEQLDVLLQAIRDSFAVENDSEITIEASPENATAANAAAWAASGINRVSLGVQSMVCEELRAVGRRHDAGTVARAFENLRAAGITNISADLIAGLPNQTAESWRRSLQMLCELRPVHLSVYMLEVDEDSRLGREILACGARYHAAAVPSEGEIADFYCAAMEFLRAAGFEQYEISNFALPGRRSRHNQKYWTNAPYFGFGTDAHSYDGERRWANADSVAAYLAKMERRQPPIVERKLLCDREKLEERFFLGLRRREGVSLSAVDAEFRNWETGNGKQRTVAGGFAKSKHGGATEEFAMPIREFCEAGLLEADGDRLRLTDRGVLFSNDVFAGFVQ